MEQRAAMGLVDPGVEVRPSAAADPMEGAHVNTAEENMNAVNSEFPSHRDASWVSDPIYNTAWIEELPDYMSPYYEQEPRDASWGAWGSSMVYGEKIRPWRLKDDAKVFEGVDDQGHEKWRKLEVTKLATIPDSVVDSLEEDYGTFMLNLMNEFQLNTKADLFM